MAYQMRMASGRWLLSAMLIGSLARPASAAPSITFVFPAGAQRGATVEATVTGTELQDANGVGFAPADISGRIVKVANATTVTLSVQVPASAALGEHEIRILTAHGASNRYRFIVGQLPEVNEKQAGADRTQAQRLDALPVTVNGQILESNRDYFRFTVAAGDTLVCRVESRSILPYIPDAVPGWLDACLTLYDPDGAQVATVDDYRLDPDPVLIYKAPAAGQYLLELKDILDRGRGYFVYRLSIGKLPHVARIEPMGGKRGAATRVALKGANLPGDTLDVASPADSPATRRVDVQAGGLVSNSVPFAVGDMPETDEKEPNDTQATAQHITQPVTVNARVMKPGDVDWYAVTARAGETLAIEIQARRLGSPMDPIVAVFNAQGQKVAENDDWQDPELPLLTRHSDSRLVYSFPAAGEYAIRVRDVQDKGGEEVTYRLLIGPPRPGFLLRSSPDNPFVARGDSALITVTATRLDGYNGPIDLSVQNVAPGFAVSDGVILPGQTTAMLTATVLRDGPGGICTPAITGAATIDGKVQSRAVTPSETVMQAFSYTMYPTARETVVMAGDAAGFSLAPAQMAVEVPQGGEVRVPLKVYRAAGASGEVTLWMAAGVQDLNVPLGPIPADKDEFVLVITASKTAAVGLRQNVIVGGTMKSGASQWWRNAQALSVKVVAAAK